jgi:magnesium transporter
MNPGNPEKSRNKKHLHKRKSGLPPGTAIYTGDKHPDTISIKRIDFNDKDLTEKNYTQHDTIPLNVDADKIAWININGLNNEALIEKIGTHFKLHNLIVEDILNVYQIPKADEYPESDLIYITLNEFYFDDNQKLQRDQISLILGDNYVLSFQEEEGDYFEIIRDRIRTAKGKIRKKCSDYLIYVLIDAIVDSYYAILDHYSNELEKIENDIFIQKNKNHLSRIHHVNKDLIYLRRAISPLNEVIFRLMKEEIILIQPESKIFLRDVLDHVQQVVNQIDVDREHLSDLVQSNMANMNSHMNEIIKVLTLISTIFIPLTFIVGVYGMNFVNFPEIHTQNGYFVVWGVMILITVIQIIIFKKKKWL